MNYKIITAIGLAGSALASLFGGWDKFLQTLLLFMAVDWFTGGGSSSRRSLGKARNRRRGPWRAGQGGKGCAGRR